MRNEVLFVIVFLGQIILLSWYMPRRVAKRVERVFRNYPPSTHPKLYLDSIEYYRLGLRNFRWLNNAVLAIGLFLLAVFIGDSTNEDYAGVVFAFSMLQYIPLFLAEVALFNHYRRMREINSDGIRKAELIQRRFTDFISPSMLAGMGGAYAIFVVFIMYVNQFNYSWFGGDANIAGVTLMNAFLLGIVAWNIYGKKLDPY